MPFGLQPIHLVVIFVVALLIFGPKRLPEIGRGVGKAINEFRKGTQEMTESLREEISRPAQDTATTMTAGAAAGPANTIAPTARVAAPAQYDPNVVTPAAQPVPEPVMAGGNFCPQCGNSNPAEARFCNKCGTQLHA